MKFDTRILQWRNPVRISLQSFSLLFRKQPEGGVIFGISKIYHACEYIYPESIARRRARPVRAFTAPSLPRRLRRSSGRRIVAIVGVTQGAGIL